MNKSNKIIPFLSLVVLAGVVALFFFFVFGNKTPDSKEKTPKPQETETGSTSLLGRKNNIKTPKQHKKEAIRDNYLETLRTIASKLDDFDERLEKVEKREALEELKAELKSQIKSIQVQNKEGGQALFTQISKKFEQKLNKINKIIKRTSDDNSQEKTHQNRSSSTASTSTGLPAGLGFDDLPLGAGNQSQTTNQKYSQILNEEYVTVKPIYSGVFATNSKAKKSKKSEISYLSEASFEYDENPSLFADDEPSSKKKSAKKDESIPYYTINETATLFSNTAITAMIGVVPTKGKVRDPYRFKVITGTENISSNGHRIDQVKNVVWSGTLTGNREMACARGTVDKVSMVFWDGTISTQRASDTVGGLGYISNKWGNPCIAGTLISNASQYLQDRLLASGAGSLAEAAAATETTQVRDSNGNIVSFVSGESKNYIASKTFSGMLGETADYVKERQADAIDVVYIPSGKDLIIHVEEQIKFDYDPNGRKLDHANTQADTASYFD